MIPDEIVIHASASDDTPGLQWAGILEYHTSYRIDHRIVTPQEWEAAKASGKPGHFEAPWADIGYHAGVEQINGKYVILFGRPWDKPGAHCPGHNAHSLGFCFVGDFQTAQPPDEQLHTAAKFLAFWRRQYSIARPFIRLHRELNDTDCPGEAFVRYSYSKLLSMMDFY